MKALPQRTFEEGAAEVAQALLGHLLVHRTPEGGISGRIVETEAYLAEGDLGNHAARGRTPRNSPMFGRAGTAYVYLAYGMHHLINVVTGPEGVPEAVLVRALEPLGGLDLMRRNRPQAHTDRQLCRGPANLAAALGIDLRYNGCDLTRPPLFLACGSVPEEEIVTATRIGIGDPVAARLELRYCLAGNRYVSQA